MATKLGKRPHPKNYAMYDARGKARYRKDLAEYHEKKKKIEAEKNKLSTKKNLDKQKTANKKAVSTTKAKTTTKSKVTPKATTTKAKSLATGKKTSTTKAVETPKVTTTTKRRTTTSKTKKPVTKKTTTTKTTTTRPAAKKPPARKPLISNKQKLQIKNAAKKTIKTGKTVGKKVVAKTKKVASNVKGKVEATRKALKKGKPPKPKTGPQKFVSKVTRGAKSYGKTLLKKGGKDLLKIGKGIVKNPGSAVSGLKGAGAAYLAEKGINQLTDRAFKQLRKETRGKNMTLKEYRARVDKANKEARKKYGIIPTAKKLVNKVRGKSNTQTSTTKNIKKQKTSNNTGLKIKKTERSSKVNRNKDYNAKTATKKRNTALSEFRVDPKENRKLQLEAQNKKPITYSRQLSTKARNQISDTKKNKNKKTKPESKFIRIKGGRLAKRGSVTARRAENRERARKRAQEAARKRRLNK